MSESAAGCARTPYGNLSVSYRGSTYAVPICSTVGELRESIAAATGADGSGMQILGKGKKLAPDLPDGTPLPGPFVEPNGKLMVMQTNRKSLPASLNPMMARVRSIETDFVKVEADLLQLLDRIGKVQLGFLDKDGTAEMAVRFRNEGKSIEERLMKCMLSTDGLTGEPGETSSDKRKDSQWRAARKALVLRIQSTLRRCDTGVESKLEEIVTDAYDEMRHRRGKS